MKLKINIRRIRKGYKVIFQIDGLYMLYLTIQAVVNAVLPFILIFFSSSIIDQITYDFTYKKVIFYVILLLVMQIVFTGVKEIASAKIQVHQSQWPLKLEQYFCDINNKMPYIDLEKPEIHILKNRIKSNQNATGAGLNTLISSYTSLVTSTISIAISILMTGGMLLKVTSSGVTGVLVVNSFWFMMFLFLIIVVSIIISVWCSGVQFKKENEQWSKLPESNRLLFYLKSNISNNLWAMDSRIYKWNDLIMKEIRKYTKNPKYINDIYVIHHKYGIINTVAMGAMRVALYLLVAIKVFYGAFGIGKFIQYTASMEQFINGIKGIFITAEILFENIPYLDDIFDYFSHAEDVNSKNIEIYKGGISRESIKFKDVYFKYPSVEDDVLKDINLQLIQGKKYAIVGENGSGKTTFVKLLCGLYKPSKGSICIGDRETDYVDVINYYKIFSVVFQDFSLFSVPLGENVSCNSSYDSKLVENALEKAGFSERLDKMKNRLNTTLYREHDVFGEEISGGGSSEDCSRKSDL